MTDEALRTVLLARALEMHPRSGDGPPWSADDAAAASVAAAQQLGTGASFDAFVVARARRVLQQLAQRVPGLPAAAPPGGTVIRGLALAGALGGLVLGLLADAGWSGGRIQLLGLPWLAVLGWNLLVFLLLAGRVLRGGGAWKGGGGRREGADPLSDRVAGQGGLTGSTGLAALAGRLAAAIGRRLPVAGPAWWRAALARQAEALQPLLAPVHRLQLLAVLHLAAAACALGLVASMYARGLVFDFRAGWDSTFLDAPQVRAVLGVLLAPAALWPGLALPDTATLAALRWAEGSAGAPAAAWIHRFAWTLGLAVVLPRALLAAWAAWQARRLAGRLALPVDGYVEALRQQAPAPARPVTVLPYNCHDSARRQASLAGAIAQWYGPGSRPGVQPVLPLGAEDDLPAGLPATGLDDVVVLMALNATPEAQNHGAFLAALQRHLPPGARCAVLLDSAAFDRRLAGLPDAADRRARRIAAWQALVAAAGLPPPRVADLGEATVDDGSADRLGPGAGRGEPPAPGGGEAPR